MMKFESDPNSAMLSALISANRSLQTIRPFLLSNGYRKRILSHPEE
jgi:hypothetical protein